MINFSIIICAYNPDSGNFSKLLDSLKLMAALSGIDAEIIIVDNNSSPSLSEKPVISDFLKSVSTSKIIVEKTPGLTAARLKGIANAKYEWLVFFDDDNEPTNHYLVNLKKLIIKYPHVGCWGPGMVKVEFVGKKIHPWYDDNKNLFQERNMEGDLFDSKIEWLDCYPFGTGLAIMKEIANVYAHNVISGKYTLTDRIGKKLVSGGDTQMVLGAIKLGYHAGTSSMLKVNHLILTRKVNMRYILSQVYMTSSCFVRAFNEIDFPNKSLEITLLNNKEIVKRIYAVFRIYFFKSYLRSFLLILYTRLGEMNARYFAKKTISKPIVLRFFERLINV